MLTEEHGRELLALALRLTVELEGNRKRYEILEKQHRETVKLLDTIENRGNKNTTSRVIGPVEQKEGGVRDVYQS